MKTLLRNRQPFVVYLDEDLRRGLYQLSQRLRMSQSSIIRQLLMEAIRREDAVRRELGESDENGGNGKEDDDGDIDTGS